MNDSPNSPRNSGDIAWHRGPRILMSGLCMGTADVVPGVSGATMAVALGIYHQLLAALKSINLQTVRALLRLNWQQALSGVHWRFLGTLGTGIVLAFIIMLKIVKLPHLLHTQPLFVYAIFFGLVFASAILLSRKVGGWNAQRGGLLLVGAALGYAVVNLVPVSTSEHPLFVFFVGSIAICAMLLPGISGAFVLLILGKYEFIFGSLENLLHGDLNALQVVVPFGLGCLVGLVAFSRVIGHMLLRFPQGMLALLTGLLLGSLWRIWPYQHLEHVVVRGKDRIIGAVPYWPESVDLVVVALMAVGLIAVLSIERLATHQDTIKPLSA